MVADFLESGSVGPIVILVHSSVSGARQWRRLMDDLKGTFRLRAVNLFGYGKTPAGPIARRNLLMTKRSWSNQRCPLMLIKYFLSAIPLVALLL
jgi:pimeloyl-ACP methyl ester carboxylesterase